MDSRHQTEFEDRRDTIAISLEAQVEYWRNECLEAREELDRLKKEARRED